MSNLKIDTLNIKKLVIDNKEYRLFNGDLYSSNFISDEQYVITPAMLTSNLYSINRKLDESDIFRYDVSASITKYNTTVTKVDERTFFSSTDISDKYCFLNGLILVEITNKVVVSGGFNYTINKDYLSAYTYVVLVKTVTINNKVLTPLSIVLSSDKINVIYKRIYEFNTRSLNIISNGAITLTIDVYTSFKENLAPFSIVNESLISLLDDYVIFGKYITSNLNTFNINDILIVDGETIEIYFKETLTDGSFKYKYKFGYEEVQEVNFNNILVNVITEDNLEKTDLLLNGQILNVENSKLTIL